jgi:hypothetical protein
MFKIVILTTHVAFKTLVYFVIPCSTEQANIAINALKSVSGELSGHTQSIISQTNTEEGCTKEKIIRHCFFNHPDQPEPESTNELEWDFNVEVCNEGLWIYTDESINTEQAAVFTQAVLLAFNLPSLIEIKAAHPACSHYRARGWHQHPANTVA